MSLSTWSGSTNRELTRCWCRTPVLQLAREIVPGLVLHASTQFTIHNAEGVRWAHAMGFSRVVLARELPLSEMEAISRATADTGMGLEVFAHGALCYSYSGQCLLSSVIGGRSGNRGMCAQPCRKKYTLVTGGVDRYGWRDRVSGCPDAGTVSPLAKRPLHVPAHPPARGFSRRIVKNRGEDEIPGIRGDRGLHLPGAPLTRLPQVPLSRTRLHSATLPSHSTAGSPGATSSGTAKGASWAGTVRTTAACSSGPCPGTTAGKARQPSARIPGGHPTSRGRAPLLHPGNPEAEWGFSLNTEPGVKPRGSNSSSPSPGGERCPGLPDIIGRSCGPRPADPPAGKSPTASAGARRYRGEGHSGRTSYARGDPVPPGKEPVTVEEAGNLRLAPARTSPLTREQLAAQWKRPGGRPLVSPASPLVMTAPSLPRSVRSIGYGGSFCPCQRGPGGCLSSFQRGYRGST